MFSNLISSSTLDTLSTVDNSLIIVDGNVDDLPNLVTNLSGVNILVLDPNQDGIEQITRALHSHYSFSSLHLVAHGGPGYLQLGNSELRWETLNHYSPSLESWAGVLNGRDVLIYGCHFAQGALGYLFLHQLHQLTGANLAASTVAVGRVDGQTNWSLDTQIGLVKTPIVISKELQETYRWHFMANLNEPIGGDLSDNPNSPETLSLSAGSNILTASTGFGDQEYVTVTIPDGFQLDQLVVNSYSPNDVAFIGVQQGTTFTEPLDNSADTSQILGYALFGPTAVSTDILDNISNGNGAIGFDGALPSGEYTFAIQQLGDQSDYELDFQVSAVQVDPQVPEVSLAIFTDNAAGDNFAVEDEGTEITFQLTLDSPAPAGGLKVYVDSNLPAILNRTSWRQALQSDPSRLVGVDVSDPFDAFRGDFLDTGFALTIAEGETQASVTVPVFDNSALPPDPGFPDTFAGLDEVTFTIKTRDQIDTTTETSPYTGSMGNDLDSVENTANGGDPVGEYTIGTASSTIFFADDASQLPGGTTNSAPVADDDSYSTDADTMLTVDAGNGVLNGDTDADSGDVLSATIATDPANGSVTLNSDGSFVYEPNAGYTGTDTFTYTVDDGNGGTDTATVSIDVGTQTGGGDPPVVSFEVVPNTFSEEADNNLVEWKWTVTGDFPADGITVNLDTSGGGAAFAFTEQFAATPQAEFVDADIVGFDENTGRLNILLTSPEASFKLYFANDIIEEGTQEFDFQLVDGDGYTVDPTLNGGIFTITDDNGGPGVGPTVGITVSETNLAEGDTFTVTFDVDGDIPADGVQILVQGDVPGSLGQFDLADLGNITTTGIAGLPEVGDGGGGSFLVTITEPTATITLDVFDDIVAEDPLDITYTIANGELYEVDPAAASTTLTISDEVQPAGPTVGLTVDKTTVVEGETLTLTIAVDGDIPPDGLQVLINDVASAQSQTRSLTEFDVSNIQLTGIADFPTPAEGDSGFFVTITEPTATITIPVIDEGANEDEAQEVFTFEVIDGEAYEVDPDASSITLSIVDVADSGGGDGPTVTLGLISGTFGDDGALVTPNLVESGSGSPILSLVLSANGEVPEDGLVVDITTDLADLTQFIQGSNFVPTTFGGEVVGAIYDDAGLATGLQIRLDSPNTVVNFTTGLTNPTDADGPFEATFTLAEGGGYQADTTPSVARLFDDIADVPVPASVPEVSLEFTSDTGTLTEGGDTGTLNFTVDGEIPADGLVVFVTNNIFGGIVDFDLLSASVTGGLFPAPDGNAGGFYFKILEPSASLTFQARVDDEIEGLEQINVALQELPGYTIADGAGDVSILVQDDADSILQVSVEASDDVLVESEGTLAVHTFNLSSPPDGGSLNISVEAPGLTELDIYNLTVEGGSITAIRPGGFDLIINGQSATVSSPISDDGVSEGLEEITFSVLEGEGYQVDPVNGTASFQAVDSPGQVPGTDTESNDTIATAVASGLTPESNKVSIDGAISFSFRNREVDQTEDVDMYSFELAAGDTVRIDADSDLFDSGLDTVLRVFDADGNEVAVSDDNFAPDELFAPGSLDSYVEYTAMEAGTYYVGISSFGNAVFDFFQNDDGTPTNDPYDPNVAGSGTGRSFGDYTLNLTLNEPFVSVETEIPDSTGEGPTVSLSASPAVYDDGDRLLASALVQFVESGASILTLELSVDGEIPEEGVEVYLNSDIDLSSAFSTRSPFNPVGEAEVLGAIFDDQGLPTGLRIKLTSNTTVINLNLDNADEAPTDGVQPVSFTLEPSAGYQVGEGTFSTPIYNTLADVPVMPDVPTVGVSISETALVESEGNLTTLTFTLDAPPPPEGVLVNVDSGVRASLGEFDVFNAEVTGGDFPTPNFQASGFFFRITEQTATITLAAFDETTNPDIPAEEALEGIDEFTFTVQPGVGYAIAPDASEITLTIADNPDSVPLPDDGGNGDSGNGSGLPTETEFNDTIADAIATGLSVTNPVYEVAGEIGTTRQTRNLIDRSEDVDMYAFDLEAGQTLILDVDGGGSGSAGVEGSLLDSVLRIFDADGNEVAINENGGAPDEVFQANGDSYIEFTAPDTATYYVGISNLGNNSYNPNVAGSGSGWTFNDRFEPGPYRLKATIDGVLVTENDSVSTNNDTIANAQVLDLSADNPNLLVEAEFAQRFEDRSNTADATEDVDMFAVQLEAGDTITIDADSVLTDFDGFPSGPAPDITIFDADGNRVVIGQDEEGEDIFAYSRQDGAPDEAFVAGRDGYLEFTATEAGTYYIGASQYRNDFYDPNVVGSGSGAVFSPRFGVSAGGPYTLAIALNPEGFNGEVYEEFGGTPAEGAPVVSFTTSAGTFGSGDVVVSSQLIESEPDATGILDFTFNVEGEIPEGGLEVLVKSDTDFSEYFEGLSSNPRVAVGGELIGGLYNAEGGLIGFRALLTANNARFPYNTNSERDDDPMMPETLNFSLANSPDYIASDTTASSDVTFYDDLSQVQSGGGPVPEVGISMDQTQLIESEGTEVTLTVNTTGDIPTDGLLVYIDSGERGFLGEFDVFNADISGGTFPSPNGAASGFFFRVFENTATITLQVFDETTNDQIPPEDALEGVEDFTLTVQPNEAYTINAATAAVDFSILDNPDSVPLPDDGGDGNGDGDGDGDPGVVLDNDGRREINDTLDTAVETGLGPNQLNVQVEGSIAVRWRNDPEQRADNTEDVDLYSFEVVAGETVDITSASVPFELDGVTQATAPTLRVFNEAGEELAISASTLADGVVTDAALSFIAPEDGTYYVGVSQYLNDNYDPVVNASGDGVQLVDEGISPGEYTLDIALTTDRPPLPVLKFTATPNVLNEEEGTALIYNFTVEGDFPTDGIVVRFDENFFDTGDQIDFNVFELDGLEFVDFEETSPGRFTVDYLLSQPQGSLTTAVFDDNVAEADFTYIPGILPIPDANYIIDPNAASASILITDGVDGTGGPVVGFTVDKTEVTEGESITLMFTAVGDIPDGGIEINVDSSIDAALGDFVSTDENGVPLVEVEGFAGLPIANGAASGFSAIMVENTATITLDVVNENEVEDPEVFDFTLLDGENYDVDPASSSVDITINDGESLPVVSFSTTPELISEADGTALVLNFSVDGDIPPEGITVNLEGNTAEILQQFLAPDGDGAVQTRVTDEGNIFYRFDTSFEPDNDNFGNIVGGTLDVFALEDGDPAEDNSDPAAAGTGFLSNFSFTITEANASITLPVSDDLAQEADQTFTYTLAEGEGYVVDSTANSGAFTVTDGITPATSPVVGVTATPATLVESEQTVFTVTFTTEGDIPVDGLVVQLQGPPRSIAEFDVNATNPRLPEDETVVEGVVVEGGNIVGTDEVAGSVFFRITNPTATITVPVFDDGPGEGTEDFTFNLVDGEAYEVDPAAAFIDVTIEDVPTEPVVSLSIEPDLLSEEDADTTLVSVSFSVDGEIPEDGLSILVTGNVNILDEVDGTRDIGFNGAVLGEFFDPETSTFEVILTDNTSSIDLPILNDIIQEPDEDFTFTVIENDGSIDSSYVVNSNTNTDTITLIDGNGGPGVGPTVGISVTETELSEGDEFTVNFTVDGDIPAEGLTILVDSETFGALGEFNIFNEDGSPAFTTTGIDGIPEVGDTGASSFLVTLTDTEASITLSVFDDGPGEGLESLTFSVIDGEVYEVSDTNGSFTLNINDESTGGGPLTTPGDDFIIAGVDFDGNGASIFAGAGNDEIDLAFDPTAQGNRVDAGSGNDLVFVSSGDRVFGGPGDDVLDASDSRGRNRLSGGEGNDDFFFGDLDGARDTGLGGAREDRFFFGLGGGNIATGGDGADQFWLVNGEAPASANRITDFELGVDIIGLQGVDDLLPGINGSMIEAMVAGSSTELSVDGNAFASISGVSPSELYIFDDEENDGRFFIGSQAQAEAAAFNRGPLG